MNNATSIDDFSLSGTLTPLQEDSISGNPFSSAIDAFSVNSVRIQGGPRIQDELMNFDFHAQNFIPTPPDRSSADDVSSQNLIDIESHNGLFNSDVNPVPLNLFQDSCDLKLNALPDHQRKFLEDLISKINYQINYFVLDDKSETKIKLTCKLCQITLHIAKVEAHVHNQEHLHNLTKKCREISNSTATASISTENWEFLDFDESSQRYRCTLCNENLSNSSNSWAKHFQSNSHYSKLNSSKPNILSNPVAALSSVMNYKPKTSATKSGKSVIAVMLEQLKDEDKGTVYNISRKLKGDITNFKPTYKLDKLYFTCTACNLILLPKNVEPHAYTPAHLNNLKQNLSSTKPEVTQKNNNSAKSNEAVSSFAQSDSNKILNVIAKDLNKQDKEIIEDFGEDSLKILNTFDLVFESEDRLNFICKICRLSLFPKYAKAHLYSCTRVKDARKNKYYVNVEDLSAENKLIVKDLLSKLDLRKLFFFQLHCKYRSNQLGLYCSVCSFNLIPEHVQYHISSTAHSEKVLTNPYSLEFESLNQSNKQIVKGLTTAIKDRMKDFCLGYKIGTEQLRLYCKFCQLALLPESVEDHVRLNEHLIAVRNSTFVSFDNIIAKDLNKQDKKIIEYFGQDSMKILNSFDVVFESEDRFNFICKICRLSLFPKYAKAHLYSCTRVKDARKNEYYVNLEDLSVENKLIVKDLLSKLDLRKLLFFQLQCEYGSNQLGLYCNVCRHNLIPEHVQYHISSIAHSEKVLTNPYSLEFESLNQSNKQIVKGLTTAIKDRMKDFCLGYKIGTEQLRLYCKFCQLALLPESVKDHVKVKEHLNLALQNLTFVSFDSLTDMHKEIVEHSMLKSEMKLNCIRILRKVGANEIYIRCTCCCLILNPAFLPEHAESSNHLNNLNLSAIFYNFAQLKESSKYILRNLYSMLGSKLNVFSLVFGAEDKTFKFKCKFCDVTVFWDTVNVDWLANHLNNENHIVIVNEDTSNNYDKPASKHFLQENSEPAIPKTVESCNLSHSSDGIYSSCATSSLHQTLLKERSSERILKNKQSCEIKSITPYNCRDCNVTINFNAENYNGLRPKSRDWLIVNCRGKSYETILTRLKKHEVSEYNAADCGTDVSSANKITTRNFGSNSIQPFSTVSILGDNSVKPKSGVLNDSDKDILKMLIDKIGIGIQEFDFVLTTSSSELRLKCKFCGSSMRPETVENHVNSEVHIKYSQLGNMTNIQFESLNDSNKKVVRKVFNQVGSEINDYNIDTTLRFVCKVCGAKLCPDSVRNHILSEEHLKRFVTPGRQDDAGLNVFGGKNCQDLPSNFAELNIITEETSCQESAQFPVKKNLRENVHPLKIEYSDDSDEENDGTSTEEIVGISEDSSFASSAGTEECLVESKVSEATPSESAELGAYRVTAEPNPPASCSEVAATVGAGETRRVSKSPSSSSYSVSADSPQEVCTTTEPCNMLPSPESKSNVTNTPILDDSRRVENESGQFSPITSGSEMAEYRCPPCDKFVHRTSFYTHVNSIEHMVATQRKLNGKCDIENAEALNKRIVEMFTGNMFIHERQVFLNLIEVYYAKSDGNLWFLCRMCKVVVCAESFQKHWSQSHRLGNNGKSHTSLTSNEIHHKMDMNGLKIISTEFQLYKQFFCRICNGTVYLESLLHHYNSAEHTHFRNDHPMRFPSFFQYKSTVLTELSNSSFLSDDFELFHETDSPKLHIYCKPCSVLLQPESLNNHVKLNEHFENSNSRFQKEVVGKESVEITKSEILNKSSEKAVGIESVEITKSEILNKPSEKAIGKESVEITKSEILNKSSETSRNASSDGTKKISQNSSSDSCSLM